MLAPATAWARDGIPRQRQGQAAQFLQVGQSPGGMGVSETLGDLQGLTEKGRGGDLGKSHIGGHFQGKAHVIPHLDKGLLGQVRGGAP